MTGIVAAPQEALLAAWSPRIHHLVPIPGPVAQLTDTSERHRGVSFGCCKSCCEFKYGWNSDGESVALWFISSSLCLCNDCLDSDLFACLASWAGFHSSTPFRSHSSCSVVSAAGLAFNLAKDGVSVRIEQRRG